MKKRSPRRLRLILGSNSFVSVAMKIGATEPTFPVNEHTAVIARSEAACPEHVEGTKPIACTRGLLVMACFHLYQRFGRHSTFLVVTLLSLMLGIYLPCTARADVAIPSLEHRITDLTGTLTPDQRNTLEAKLQALENSKGSQVAVLIVPTTEPEAIEQYSIRVVDAWKLGRKRIDDGVLLLVAKDDRTLRIEVGRGLEGSLTDALSRRIIDEIIVPHFREGNFYAGIEAGLNAISIVVQGEPLPLPPPGFNSGGEDPAILGVISFFVGSQLGNGLATLISRGIAAVITGLAGGILVYGLTAASVSFISPILVGLLVGALLFLSVLFKIVTPSGSSRSSGSSSRSGGGFSGGGGGFSGGGSSGRW